MRPAARLTKEFYSTFSSRLASSGVRCCKPCTSNLSRAPATRTLLGSRDLIYASQLPEDFPRIPLSEKAAIYEAPAAQVVAWCNRASQDSRAAAQNFNQTDDPSAEDLLKDLHWLLEDVVEQHWPTLRVLHQETSSSILKLRLPLEGLQELWQRRLKDRVPLQYLANAAHWRHLVLAVGPGVLVPRPETECLIDFAVQAATAVPRLNSGIWADLGTGSGALALGTAISLQQVEQAEIKKFDVIQAPESGAMHHQEVWAVDQSAAACLWASFNVSRLGMANRIQVHQGSWYSPLQHLRGQISGILSNPPYIKRSVLPELQAEVRRHEPAAALNGGEASGMDCLGEICAQAGEFLRPGGFIALETGGPEQTPLVARMLEGAFHAIERRQDMYGVERFVTAFRRS